MRLFLLFVYNGKEKKIKEDVSQLLDESEDEDRGSRSLCSNDNDEIDNMHETSDDKSLDNNICDEFSQTQNLMGELYIFMDQKEIWQYSHSISHSKEKDLIMQYFVTGTWTISFAKRMFGSVLSSFMMSMH